MLFIEPQQPPSDQPVIDDATRKMAGAYRRSQPSRYESCGFHSCSCGAISDHVNHVLPDGTLTNSLCVHYLAYHRHEVSAFELGYARQLSEDGVLQRAMNFMARNHPVGARGRSIVFGGGTGGGSGRDGRKGRVARLSHTPACRRPAPQTSFTLDARATNGSIARIRSNS